MVKFKCILCGNETMENRVVMCRFIFVRGKVTQRSIECCQDCFDVSEKLMKNAEAVIITAWLLASNVDLSILPE